MRKTYLHYKAYEKQKKPKYAVVDVVSSFKTLYTQKWESIGPTSVQSRSGKAVITYRYVGLCRLP